MPLKTGYPASVVAEAKAALKDREIVGQVLHGKGGLGLVSTTPLWQKATPTEHHQLVVEEVRHQEEATRHARAVSQAQQGSWMNENQME